MALSDVKCRNARPTSRLQKFPMAVGSSSGCNRPEHGYSVSPIGSTESESFYRWAVIRSFPRGRPTGAG
jgi:hypothetical protein